MGRGKVQIIDVLYIGDMHIMNKKFLAIISLLLCIASLLSCVSCSADSDGEYSESSTNWYSGGYSDTSNATSVEKATEKKTEKVTKKTTQKKTETTLVPGVSKADTPLSAKTYDFANMSTSDQLYFKFLSRAKTSSSGLIFDMSCATLEFQGYMTGDVIVEINSQTNLYYGQSYFTVYIDGKRSATRFKVGSGKTEKLKIATFTGNYYHTVKIVKQTEFKWSLATIKTLQITGYLNKISQEKEYYVEFLGDSLTTAYGNIGTPSVDGDIADSPDYQDGTKSYAYLFADAIGADYSMISRSAAGLSQCWDSNSPILDYYKKHSKDRNSEDFDIKNARKPDLIVLHLGANDYNVGGSNKTNFVSKGKELIDYFRTNYGTDVPIIWAYDPNEGFPDKVKEIINYYGGESAGYYTLALPWSEAGAGGHPSANEHQKHAKLLVDLVISKNIIK